MLWDSDATLPTDETVGWQLKISEQPKKNADNEELYGNRDGSDMNTDDKMHFRENGGMTGYRYLSPWSMCEITLSLRSIEPRTVICRGAASRATSVFT